ncbi:MULTISPECIES: hypothetical protein [Staphylococcus]|uniref:hypothetical protein n=1 Tax=Staphylococcus TaxID=1279 RepID=UPI00290037CF|nr:hypothetical protein [Staphylococcus haemolyticus]MDU0444744.1 hypothetical protein [Staphylococcus haemolyticus]
MKLVELQKLDFLLKIVNSHSNSKEHKLVFNLNDNLYAGDFIPRIKSHNMNTTFDVELKDNQVFENDIYNYVSVTNNNIFNDLRQRNRVFNKSQLGLLIERSHTSNKQEYFDCLFSNYEELKSEFNFSDDLPNYIYNIKCLSTNLPINFLKIDKDVIFDFISIIPEDELQN